MKVTILTSLFLLLVLPAIFSDKIELENGDQVTGKIVQMNEDTVTIKAEYGVLVIKRRYIKKGLFAVNPEIPRDGLLVELLFNSNFIDSSGNRFTVKNINTALGPDKNELPSSAAHADGSGQYLSIISSKQINDLEAFTVSFWFTIRNLNKSQYIVSKWNSTSGDKADGKFAILFKAGYVSCYVVDGKGAYYSLKSEERIPINTWTHAAFICTKDKFNLFINGKKTADKSFEIESIGRNESPVFLLTAKGGNDNKMSYYNTEGGIDSFRLYGRVLSETEIGVLCNEFSGS
jgi:hypothetical protein